jgi:hypothetical protein
MIVNNDEVLMGPKENIPHTQELLSQPGKAD